MCLLVPRWITTYLVTAHVAVGDHQISVVVPSPWIHYPTVTTVLLPEPSPPASVSGLCVCSVHLECSLAIYGGCLLIAFSSAHGPPCQWLPDLSFVCVFMCSNQHVSGSWPLLSELQSDLQGGDPYPLSTRRLRGPCGTERQKPL